MLHLHEAIGVLKSRQRTVLTSDSTMTPKLDTGAAWYGQLWAQVRLGSSGRT